MPTPRAQVAATKPKKITQWSYSRLRDWLQCGAYAKFKFIDRLKEPGNKAMERGGEIHTMAQNYVEAKTKPRRCPDELITFQIEFDHLRKVKALCESEWAFTSAWAPTGWFDEDCWLRVKMDVHYLDVKENCVHVVDHKTGKVAPWQKYNDQEELYALGALLQYPDAESVNVQFWYLDAGVIGSSGRGHLKGKEPTEDEQALGAIYTRADLPKLKAKWMRNVKPMLNDVTFKAKPTSNCRYCHFSKAKGGPCKF
jgi:hypothetical protein